MKKQKHTREEKLQAFGRLLDIQDRLRSECPWDRKQTNESLRPYTIEEVFELCDALMEGNHKEICKELGDVMEHVVFYAMLGEENGDFDIADVCNAQSDKLMFRHDFIDWNANGDWTVSNPDLMIDEQGQVVYKGEESIGNTPKPTTAAEVSTTWEQRKQQEKDGNETILSGVPKSLPSLIKAYRIQDKAMNVGFDWKHKEDVWAKVHEELSELEAEFRHADRDKATSELGDFLFSVINAARLYHLNPDNALERTNQKFIHRFNYVEQMIRNQHKDMKNVSLEEMDCLWEEAKKLEKE